MNPLTNTRNITKLSERELQGTGKGSWHDEYKSSAWIFFGGLPYDLTEGDVLSIFSQYGEIVNINYIRDKATGKPKGFGFLCYEDQRSTVLAVDNFNGVKILGRTIRVDHVKDYKVPKDSEKLDDLTRKIMDKGCAPGVQLEVPKTETDEELDDGGLLPLRAENKILPKSSTSSDKLASKKRKHSSDERSRDKKKLDRHRSHKSKKRKHKSKSSKKKRKKRKHKKSSSSSSSESSSSSSSSSSESSDTD